MTEDGVLTASGSLSVSDADSGQSVFAPVEASALIGSYGTWNFNSSSGAWSYLLDNNNASVEALSTGSSLTDSLTVQSFDGSDSETITVTINGASYPASISGTSTGSVTEDGVLTASGSLSVSDADSGQSVFAPVEASALIGSYGTWNFIPAPAPGHTSLTTTMPRSRRWQLEAASQTASPSNRLMAATVKPSPSRSTAPAIPPRSAAPAPAR